MLLFSYYLSIFHLNFFLSKTELCMYRMIIYYCFDLKKKKGNKLILNFHIKIT